MGWLTTLEPANSKITLLKRSKNTAGNEPGNTSKPTQQTPPDSLK
jgi:hypothetical protein